MAPTSRPRGRTRAVLAASTAVVFAIATAADIGLGIARGDAAPALPFTADDIVWALSFLAFGLVGALIVARVPGNPIGPLYLTAAAFGAASRLAFEYAAWAMRGGGGGEAAAIAAWISAWAWAPALGAIVASILVFPTGRPVSPRWRWVIAVEVAATAVITVAGVVTLWPVRGPVLIGDTQVELDGHVAERIVAVAFPIVLICAVLAMISLIVRYVRGGPRERRQLKLLAVVAGVCAGGIVVSELVFRARASALADVIAAPGWLALAAGVAILRHGLFEIDRIVSRAVAYALLSATLGAIYVTSVVGSGAILRALAAGASDDLSVAASTLVVAALVGPLRRRFQTAVDRRFDRARYDAARTIDGFAQRLRDEVDLDALVGDIDAVVHETVNPRHVSVWLPA